MMLRLCARRRLQTGDTAAFIEAVAEDGPATFPEVFDRLPRGRLIPRAECARFFRSFAFAAASSFPQPGAGWQVQPLPLPAADAPCLCGSGQNFADCCGGWIESGSPFPPEVLGALLVAEHTADVNATLETFSRIVPLAEHERARIERVSAGLLNQVLRTAWQSPWYAEFESALPIVGLDGTLARRFNGSPAQGRARLKTGTLRDVAALAGVVQTEAGRRVAFVLLVNHAHARRAGEAQRVLLDWTVAGMR